MMTKCPACGKGNSSPCEICNTHWKLEEGIKLDKSFEIISLKEKYLKEQLAVAQDSLIKSEFNVAVNKEIIKITEEEIKKESEKNAR